MNDRVPPNNTQAEDSLLGAMLLSNSAVSAAAELLDSSDFYQPTHGAIFDTILRLFRRGEPIDTVTVAEELRREKSLDWIGGGGTLVQLQSNTPAISSARRYAQLIAEDALLRRFIRVAEGLADSAYERTEPTEILDTVNAALGAIDMPEAELPKGLVSVDEFMRKGPDQLPQWVIPGLMRDGWRQMIVAEEGAGKTLLSQQLGLAAARGVHPFTYEPLDAPVRVLFVDLENPEERLLDGFQMIDRGITPIDPQLDQAWLWHRPGGINLRTRTDRAALEAVIADTRPQLVCICPLYKAYSHTARETDEQAAREVMTVFDDLRIRYHFALLIEHHAPKKQGGFRELLPYGSVLWMRWCEMGLSLVRDPEQPEGEDLKYLVGRHRQDRVRSNWPKGLMKSTSGLPWEAIWPEQDWHTVVPRAAEADVNPF